MPMRRELYHCFLFELDRVVDQSKQLDYARFMDDIDIGAHSLKDTKKILKRINLVLQTRQVRLNSGKTKIMSKAEANRHFKIRQNVFLNKFVARINSKYQNGLSLNQERTFTRDAIEYGFRNKIFEDGNGEKILKRLITIATKIIVPISTPRFSDIVRNWPNTREHVMWHYSLMPHDKGRFEALISYVAEEHYVDDVSWINFAKCVVTACTPREDYIYE